MKIMKKKRGFIGPLGDDIPSIFPILAGMLLFIGTILYANNQVDLRSNELQLREATQRLAYLSTAKGNYLPGEFALACNTSIRPFGENQRLKFAVVVKRFCDRGCPSCSSGIDLENSNIFDPDETGAGSDAVRRWREENACTNLNPEVEAQYRASRDTKQYPVDLVSLVYPVAVPCPDPDSPSNGLGTVNVLVWK